ncbi:acetyl/propionyl/methylcrotonyl-CoA carboxylase subunit alpha [Ammoniphilus sp. 3BR4]|uniref:acetyl-CoA carboxylase biotin carboxylase subunit n=1 Tax=Ammoniphilus sp. 3BR4 TaxID=3158265 RepID=UPI003467D484
MQKILIANRGEIARRVIRTCKDRGIATVAVFSEADRDMPFVREADERLLIGPPPVAQSYLKMEEVIKAAKQTGAQAIHPGYGLLSENSVFAQRCEEEGIIFLGPSPNVIKSMGDKIEARKIMEKAGVPVVPGYSGNIDSAEEACKIATQVGYPVMLKASAGGGGIGMQLCYSDEDIKKAFQSARGRAKAYFGSDAMFIEKYIEHPHHIEVQIAGDAHGGVIHLLERECSVQRRHQKVIEESPSPFLDEATREAVCQAAIRAAQAVCYTGVGTVEFIMGKDRSFYFLEMNTRLQVEHPVTEEITGIDLVGMQIDIAEGKPLPAKQEEIKAKAHAIELRVYAEDPKTFLPSPGKILAYEMPSVANLRIDDGVEAGSDITPYYDPMIAKVILSGKTRDEAIDRALNVLQGIKIEGIKTNVPMLKQVLEHERFQKGDYDTTFVQTYLK